MIPFQEWLPDLPPLRNPGATVAKNCIPEAIGYRPFPAFNSYSAALAARCQGSVLAEDSAGVVYNYAGTSTKLYVLGGTAWTDVTRASGGNYSLSTTEYWEFAVWGNKVIATELTDVPQIITLGDTNFTALSGSPPKAKHLGIIKNFVVLGNLNESGTLTPHKLRWSGTNDETAWSTSSATQSDVQELRSDTTSAIQRIVGGEYGSIFTKTGIWRMTYVGGNEVFQFDLIEKARGTIAPMSVVAWGTNIFYLAGDGFFMFNGGVSIPIGENKVNKTFFAEADSNYYHRVTGAVDPTKEIVLWAYPGSGSTSGTPNKVLIYHWPTQKWALVEQAIEILGVQSTAAGASAYTMDNMDTDYPSLDAIPFSFDSLIFGGSISKPILAGFDTNHALGFFNGSAMSATLETAEQEHNPGQRTFVSALRPLVDGGSSSATVGYRNLQSGPVLYGSAVTQDATGYCNTRNTSRFQRYRVTTSGEFNHAQGVNVEGLPAGGR